jgi:hypothetical protein
MMFEWNCSRLVSTVARIAVPIAPPRLRSMFERPEAAPASAGAMPAVVMALIGVRTSAWPMARVMFGISNWSPTPVVLPKLHHPGAETATRSRGRYVSGQLREALGALALDGSLTTLDCAAGRKATIDVTNLIWQRASIRSFILFAQPQPAWVDVWNSIVPLPQSGAIKPIVAKTFPLAQAADALRYLIERRPFGRVVLTI